MKKIVVLITLCLVYMMSSFKIVYAQTDEIYQRVVDSGKLIVGTSSGYPPFEFFDTKGNLIGFDMDIAQGIAQQISQESGKDITVEFADNSFDNLIADLQTKRVDIVLAGMTPTPERAQQVDFSDVYYHFENVVMINQSDKAKLNSIELLNNANVTLAIQTGTIQEAVAKKYFPKAHLVSLKLFPDMVLQLSQHQLSGIIISKENADLYLEVYPELTYSDVKMSMDDDLGAAAAFPKNSPKMVEVTNAYFSKIQNNHTIDQIWEKNVALASSSEIKSQQVDNGILSQLKKVYTYKNTIIKGLLLTLALSFLAVVIGTTLGTVLTLLRHIPILGRIIDAYISFIRGTPLLVQLAIFAYTFTMPDFGFGRTFASFLVGLLALSVNSSAYVAEIIRAGLNAVDKGQFEAAETLGLNKFVTMKSIILPQAIKNILPALGNEFISVIKESSIVSIIGLIELMKVTEIIRAQTYIAFTPLIVVACIYFIITTLLTRLLTMYEKYLNKSS